MAVLAFLLVAGCTTPVTDDSTTDAPTPEWRLACPESMPDGWAQSCLMRATTTAGSKTEAWLAVNPKDPQNVVLSAKDNNPESSQGCTWNGLAVTKDGGATWTAVTIGGAYDERAPGDPWYGYSCNTDPMFTFDADGDLHYVMELYNLAGPNGSGPLGPDPVAGRALLLAGWKLLLVTSHDGGMTFPDVVTMLEADGVTGINDYSRVTVNPTTGTVLTAINSFSGGPFVAASAAYNYCSVIAVRDGQASVYRTAAPEPGTPPEQATAQPTCMEIVASPEGKVALLFSDGFGTAGVARIATSTDDGATFTAPSESFTYKAIPARFDGGQYRTGTNFEAAYDLTNGTFAGRLYVLTAEDAGTDSAPDSDLRLRWSDDDGAMWQGPVNVTSESTARYQFMANLAVAGDGSLHVFFLERGAEDTDNLLFAHHAVSLDGGATWTTQPLADAGWDGDKGVHQEGFPFVGDYVGADAAAAVAWGGFPDASSTEVPTLAAAKLVLS